MTRTHIGTGEELALTTATEEERIVAVYARRRGHDPRNSVFSPGRLFLLQERERRFVSVLRKRGFTDLQERSVLEVGCGTGHWLRQFIAWGARPERVVGVDLLPDSVAEARLRCPADLRVACGSAADLPHPDGSFDIVLQATMFTSVLDPQVRRRIADEMLRVLKPNGVIIWYDFRIDNPRNPDVRGIGRAEIVRLFPGCDVDLQRVTPAPPLIRALAPRSWLLCQVLAAFPFLCTHYLAAIWKRTDGAGPG